MHTWAGATRPRAACPSGDCAVLTLTVPFPHHHDLTIILRSAPASLSHCCDALTQPSTTVSLRPNESPIHPRASTAAPAHLSRPRSCRAHGRSPRPATSTYTSPFRATTPAALSNHLCTCLRTVNFVRFASLEFPCASIALRTVARDLHLRAAI